MAPAPCIPGGMTTLLLLLALPALASEPEVELDASGMIVGRIIVPAAPEEVAELVADPVAVGRLSPDIVSVASEPATARCNESFVAS